MVDQSNTDPDPLRVEDLEPGDVFKTVYGNTTEEYQRLRLLGFGYDMVATVPCLRLGTPEVVTLERRTEVELLLQDELLPGTITNCIDSTDENLTPFLVSQLLPSETLMGFLSWLTVRHKSVTFGREHDAAVAVELYELFKQYNPMAEIRENWTDFMNPPGEDK